MEDNSMQVMVMGSVSGYLWLGDLDQLQMFIDACQEFQEKFRTQVPATFIKAFGETT